MDRAAIIGLGNPGSRYRATRHNAGFAVIGELCRRWRVTPKEGRGPYLLAEARWEEDGPDVLLVAPTTYMNNSGEAVRDIVERFGISLSSLLIVVDDFWLPLGRLRYRKKGSDGGHNGLASIIAALESDEIPRLRLGIGKPVMPPKSMMADFVLSPFDPDEVEAVKDMVSRAGNGVEEFIHKGYTTPKNPADDKNPTSQIT